MLRLRPYKHRNPRTAEGSQSAFTKPSKSLICRVSSVVEQRFCKPLVAGSNPAPGTIKALKIQGFSPISANAGSAGSAPKAADRYHNKYHTRCRRRLPQFPACSPRGRGMLKKVDGARLSAPSSKAGQLQRACLALLKQHERDDAIPTNVTFLFYELEQQGVVPKAYRDAGGNKRPRTQRLDDQDEAATVPCPLPVSGAAYARTRCGSQ